MTHLVMSTTGLRGISTSTGLLMSLSLTASILMVIYFTHSILVMIQYRPAIIGGEGGVNILHEEVKDEKKFTEQVTI